MAKKMHPSSTSGEKDSHATSGFVRTKPRRITVPDFYGAKKTGRKLAVLTAYDFMQARLLDEAGVDAILVGDSVGTTVQGRETTLPVTLDQMIYHGEMVVRAVQKALVIVDMPFMSFQEGPRQAVRNAGRILKETGAAAVKLEGGAQQAKTIAALSAVDLPVMAHVGMRPQSVRKLGRMSAVQRDREALLKDALAAQNAGAFAIVLELIPQAIAREITNALTIPTIGIGAGPDCDGQVLVTPDLLGLSGFEPRFVRRYAELGTVIRSAVGQYITDVREGTFPSAENCHQ